jgi:cation diffusion facilitator CzcD-associated flavoprotein CzcO
MAEIMDRMAPDVLAGSRPGPTVEYVNERQCGQRKPTVLIIGAGIGGIGLGVSLLRAGFTEFTILERAGDIGGVWRENTYPGAACDVPSPLYSYSFAPNPSWPRRYSRQPDILDYLRRTAAGTGVLDRVRCDTEVTGARFDEAGHTWEVATATGQTYTADVLVSAVGQLSRPVLPRIPGAEKFTGPLFHSARWEHGVDLTGKRIAVIGTGASAVQFVPQLQPTARRLTVFQRSAPYVVPRPDRGYRPWHHRMFRWLPGTQLIGRAATWLVSEFLNLALTTAQPLGKLVRGAFHLHLRHQVEDPELRARLTPDYQIGCKRLLFSNDWYPALTQPNVNVVTDSIAEITEHGVRTADGLLHPAEVIIYGTGFAATEFLAPMRIQGRHGQYLGEEWAEGARAYLGMTVPGFPNMFCVYGPNTNLGGSSIIFMMEQQFGYILQVLRRIADGTVSCVDVRRYVADVYDAEMQRRLGESVWSGCASWYREDSGRISTNWPGLVSEYRRRTARLDLTDYEDIGAGDRRQSVGVA